MLSRSCFLRIKPAHLEIVDRQFRAQAQFNIGQQSCGGLCVGPRLLDRASDLTPQIRLPLRLARDAQRVELIRR